MPGVQGRSGRFPTPIELKRRMGETRPSRIPPKSETLAVVPISDVDVPAMLQEPGRELWISIVTMAGWIGRTDQFALETLCRLQDEKVAMTALVTQQGYVLEEPLFTPKADVMGQRKVAHPLLKEIRALTKQQNEIAAALGLSPTARSRLGVAEVKVRSKLEELRDKQHDRRMAAKVADRAPARSRKPRANRRRVHRKLLPGHERVDRRSGGAAANAAPVAESTP